MDKTIYEYITTEESAWKTNKIPLSNSKEWNMSEHIERCYNVSNGWFHKGNADDENRPYDDIVTPIIDVAFRLEGFDVKDIQLYVDEVKNHYKSFVLKKYHPDWAKKNQLDTFIDEVVESSVIYDLALVKDINDTRPELVNLQTIAFCDQSDILNAPICIKHQYSITDLLDFKGKWDSDKIDEAIIMAKASKEVSTANNKDAKSNGKFITVYEIHGKMPAKWLDENESMNEFVDQMHIVCFWLSKDGKKNGITLYKGKDRPLNEIFFPLKIDQVRSYGRACGKSIVERLFQPQVWRNYSGIKLKKMLDASVNLLQTESNEVENQKLKGLPEMTVIKHEQGKPLSRVDMGLQNVQAVTQYQDKQEMSARMLGSASEASLGINPSSGTPFALQDLIVQQGEGTHDYRQGKIATFFADILYPKIIIPSLFKDIGNGKKFSEELDLDEVEYLAETISSNVVENKIKDLIFGKGIVPTEEERELMKQAFIEEFRNGKTNMYQGGRGFFEFLKDELKDAPIKVKVNIAGKQKYLARDTDKLSKLIQTVMANPQAFAMIPGLQKAFNQLIESSGMNPVDFSGLLKNVQQAPDIKTKQTASIVDEAQLKEEQK